MIVHYLFSASRVLSLFQYINQDTELTGTFHWKTCKVNKGNEAGAVQNNEAQNSGCTGCVPSPPPKHPEAHG